MDGNDTDLTPDEPDMKCLLNNDVSKQVNDNSVVNGIFSNNNNNMNIQNSSVLNCVLNKNSQLNNELIECVELDSSDSEDEPPLKMARLSPRASTNGSGQSSSSPAHSPLTRTPDLESDCVKENLTNSCDKLSKTEDDLIETEKCGNCIERVNISERIADRGNDSTHSNQLNTMSSITNHCTPSNPNHNQSIQIKAQTYQTLVQQLIGICLEKRFQTQTKQFSLEQEFITTIETLKQESIHRNNKLNQIKALKQKASTDFSDKQIQVDITANQNHNHIEDSVLKVKTEKKVSFQTQTNNHLSNKSSILKAHLMAPNDDKKDVDNDNKPNNNTNKCLNGPQLKNGLNKELNNSLNNRLTEPTASTQSTSSDNSESNNNNNNSDDFEVVTIDSDDDEPTESHFAIQSTGLSKSSHYNHALPQPKLSVSINKHNNNHSFISQNNTSIQRKSFLFNTSSTEKDLFN